MARTGVKVKNLGFYNVIVVNFEKMSSALEREPSETQSTQRTQENIEAFRAPVARSLMPSARKYVGSLA
ncbi:hypothetical protein Trydic_g13669 [Trypoxylus dichotomus]